LDIIFIHETPSGVDLGGSMSIGGRNCSHSQQCIAMSKGSRVTVQS
jgi:hypothetical protein